MKQSAKSLFFLPILLSTLAFLHLRALEAGNAPAGQDVVLKAADISPKIFPEHVFFRGQAAPAQLRNTGGVHFADDFYVLAGLVDSSGYSTAIREKYQAYLLNEVTLEIGGADSEARRLWLRFPQREKICADGPRCQRPAANHFPARR